MAGSANGMSAPQHSVVITDIMGASHTSASRPSRHSSFTVLLCRATRPPLPSPNDVSWRHVQILPPS